MWHVSIAPLYSGIPEEYLRRWAYDTLAGVGDASAGQWEEYSGRAYHLKRRLSAKEQRKVGDTVDVRGTAEAEKRRMTVLPYIPPALQNWIE